MSDQEGYGMDSQCYTGLYQSEQGFREEHVCEILLQDCRLLHEKAIACR